MTWREAEGALPQRPAGVTLSAHVAFTPRSGTSQALDGWKTASIVLGAAVGPLAAAAAEDHRPR